MSKVTNELIKYFLTNPIIILIIVLGFLSAVFYKQILGWFGEHWTKQALRKLPKDKYILLNDIFIKASGLTHQIDHIVVSQYGIFCIETKQYNGYITGSKYDKNWVRHFSKKKINCINPIRQNYGHVKAISELLKIDENKIFNIVCIPSKAKLKIQDDGETVRYDTVADKILSYDDTIIDNVSEIINTIKQNNIIDKNQKKEHIRSIKENATDKDFDKCPICGGQLVERKSKYGKFYGCSNYPKCTYIKK